MVFIFKYNVDLRISSIIIIYMQGYQFSSIVKARLSDHANIRVIPVFKKQLSICTAKTLVLFND